VIYVLDTDTCIYFLNGNYPSIADEISSRSLEDLAITSISAAELFYGAYHSARKTKNIERLDNFFEKIQILPFDNQSAKHFGELKENLHREGKMLGPYDLLIASIVDSQRHTLVTHNVKEFSQVKGLLVVDWIR
jgi:tRNA(fMet)-specific endonuclease VapC